MKENKQMKVNELEETNGAQLVAINKRLGTSGTN